MTDTRAMLTLARAADRVAAEAHALCDRPGDERALREAVGVLRRVFDAMEGAR